jgi:glycosyltransferase involved in cell wall biosynthesis
MAGVLKLLTGAKLIIEIVTAPKLVALTDRPNPTGADRLKHLYSDLSLHLSLLMADRAHFLCPGQLSAYPLLRKVRNSVFHEFVPVSIIDRAPDRDETQPFILLVGAPWYLKGVDLLIRAFRNLSPDFPQVKLKLLGHFPDRAPLDALAGGLPQIEILRAVPNPEALRLINRAAILVLPSRCEGGPRVLIEGMAAGIPLIGSDVGGIPYMVRDGENGFVFPAGDSQALEAKLRQLLADSGLRRRLGDRGYELAHNELNEQTYVDEFARMVEDAVHGNP